MIICNIDIEIVFYAALLHDIADHKFYNNDRNIGPYKTRLIL